MKIKFISTIFLVILSNFILKGQKLTEFGDELIIKVHPKTKAYEYSRGFQPYFVVNDTIPIYATGMKYDRYQIKQNGREGWIDVKDLTEKLIITPEMILKASEIKKAKLENELLKLRNECQYITNEIDVFDKVRIIRSASNIVADGLRIFLYSRAGKKEVVFQR